MGKSTSYSRRVGKKGERIMANILLIKDGKIDVQKIKKELEEKGFSVRIAEPQDLLNLCSADVECLMESFTN